MGDTRDNFDILVDALQIVLKQPRCLSTTPPLVALEFPRASPASIFGSYKSGMPYTIVIIRCGWQWEGTPR